MATTKQMIKDTGANLDFEAKLWAAADALRNNMDAAEYKHVVLGLNPLRGSAVMMPYPDTNPDKVSGFEVRTWSRSEIQTINPTWCRDSDVPRRRKSESRHSVLEALANAFVHRDYAIGGGSVGVALYDDRLEIISIGDLHFGLTPEALFREHESKPWNPMIARTFYRRGIIETWGRGTLKIARLMREAGHEPPTVAVRQGAVIVTFWLPGEVTGKMTGETPQKTPQNTAEAILVLLKQQPGLSFAEMAPLLRKSESAVKRAVRKLRESGRLERIGPDKGGRWKVLK